MMRDHGGGDAVNVQNTALTAFYAFPVSPMVLPVFKQFEGENPN